MIVYHGTTVDCREGILAEGLRPGTYVAPNKASRRTTRSIVRSRSALTPACCSSSTCPTR